jgi:Coenzyme PQQ synthesis protein D (PqqD)
LRSVRKSHPLARTDGLLTENVDGEVLVFDQAHEVACRLNESAALVWRHCDGKRTVADLVAVLKAELGDVADEDMVMIALDNLVEHDLIASGYERRDPNATRFSRRHFIRRMGTAAVAAASAPIVYSMLVPAPSAAASGGGYMNNYEPYLKDQNPLV